MSSQTVCVDVREDLRRGAVPFSRIMEAVHALRTAQDLCVIAPFEPTPLMKLLGKQGFTYISKEIGGGDFEVTFRRKTGEAAQEEVSPSATKEPGPVTSAAEPVQVDTRGQEPPQPMVNILEALETLQPGQILLARTDRRPMHLYAQLEARGYAGTSEEHPDGGFITRITRA